MKIYDGCLLRACLGGITNTKTIAVTDGSRRNNYKKKVKRRKNFAGLCEEEKMDRIYYRNFITKIN